MRRCRTAALLLLVISWPTVAAIDTPWKELDSSLGGHSGFVGLVVAALAYGAWRPFLSGDLGSLLGSVVRFLIAVYLPGLLLADAVLASVGLQAASLEKGTAGVLALMTAGGIAWLVVRITLGRKSGASQRRTAPTEREG